MKLVAPVDVQNLTPEETTRQFLRCAFGTRRRERQAHRESPGDRALDRRAPSARSMGRFAVEKLRLRLRRPKTPRRPDPQALHRKRGVCRAKLAHKELI
jgi:hypothetical protein